MPADPQPELQKNPHASDPDNSPSRRIASTLVIGVLVLALAATGVAFLRRGSPRSDLGATTKVGTAEAIRAVLDAAAHYRRSGELAQAEAVLRGAIVEHLEDQELRVAHADALTAMRRFPEAYEEYVAALAIGPRTAELEFAAGTLANTAGKTDRALEHYSMAQTADPTKPVYPLYLGLIQAKLGEVDAARASLLRAANMDPQNAVAWGTLADLAIRENKPDIALQHVAKARELQPSLTEWRLIEARALKRLGKPESALELLTPLDPSERARAPVVRLIGECFGMLDRPTDAASAFALACGAAAADDPELPVLCYEAAVWYRKADAMEKARSYALRARELGHPDAAALAAELQ